MIAKVTSVCGLYKPRFIQIQSQFFSYDTGIFFLYKITTKKYKNCAPYPSYSRVKPPKKGGTIDVKRVDNYLFSFP